MKKIQICLGAIFILFILNSCKNSDPKQLKISEILESTEDGSKIITNKIMYDVPVVNEIIGDRSKNNPDWFWANLPAPEGDEFLKNLLDDAIDGKLKTYYYDMMGDYEVFNEIPESKLKDFMSNVMTFRFDMLDTLMNPAKLRKIEVDLDYKNIKMLRFLEEWYIKDGMFCKKVIAVAPFFTIEHPALSEPHNSVFFWILMTPED